MVLSRSYLCPQNILHCFWYWLFETPPPLVTPGVHGPSGIGVGVGEGVPVESEVPDELATGENVLAIDGKELATDEETVVGMGVDERNTDDVAEVVATTNGVLVREALEEDAATDVLEDDGLSVDVLNDEVVVVEELRLEIFEVDGEMEVELLEHAVEEEDRRDVREKDMLELSVSHFPYPPWQLFRAAQ